LSLMSIVLLIIRAWIGIFIGFQVALPDRLDWILFHAPLEDQELIERGTRR
jgi:hypothetical protein